jgi:serine/threonine protein kinase
MLYEMIAGRSPFAAPSGSDAIATILQNEPAPLTRFEPDAPAELQRILTKTLRKERSQRYQTVPDLLLACRCFAKTSAHKYTSGARRSQPGLRPA